METRNSSDAAGFADLGPRGIGHPPAGHVFDVAPRSELVGCNRRGHPKPLLGTGRADAAPAPRQLPQGAARSVHDGRPVIVDDTVDRRGAETCGPRWRSCCSSTRGTGTSGQRWFLQHAMVGLEIPPACGSRLAIAIPNALVTRAAVWLESIDHPTTRRGKVSNTTAQYTEPSRVSCTPGVV